MQRDSGAKAGVNASFEIIDGSLAATAPPVGPSGSILFGIDGSGALQKVTLGGSKGVRSWESLGLPEVDGEEFYALNPAAGIEATALDDAASYVVVSDDRDTPWWAEVKDDSLNWTAMRGLPRFEVPADLALISTGPAVEAVAAVGSELFVWRPSSEGRSLWRGVSGTGDPVGSIMSVSAVYDTFRATGRLLVVDRVGSGDAVEYGLMLGSLCAPANTSTPTTVHWTRLDVGRVSPSTMPVGAVVSADDDRDLAVVDGGFVTWLAWADADEVLQVGRLNDDAVLTPSVVVGAPISLDLDLANADVPPASALAKLGA